jgi:hypothetical protein
MNIIQTYYNKKVSTYGLNLTGGYLYPEINWLSIAYSCLLLKKNNSSKKLILYGNEDVVKLLIDTFQLPYDKFVVLRDLGIYADWFYCWPKIATYSMQKEPFVHVDTDVFMWKPMPRHLYNADLVAQHMERDSIFYREVYDNVLKDRVRTPQCIDLCKEDPYIKSYNAGLLGGRDLNFFKKYTDQIFDFVNKNESLLKKSDKKFLYNVLMEQWIFYALSKQEGKRVSTYYESIVTDFKMPGMTVPKRVVNDNKLEYLHLMEYKDNIRCNRFVAYRMAMDFPSYYERIVEVCRSSADKCHINSLKGIYSISSNFSENGLDKPDLKEKLLSIKDEGKALYSCFKEKGIQVKKEQVEQYKLFEEARCYPEVLMSYKIKISPYLKVISVNKDIEKKLFMKSSHKIFENPFVLIVYNAIFDNIDEFVWSGSRVNLLKEFKNGIILKKIFLHVEDRANKKIFDFIRQCLFDNIVYCIKDENTSNIL